MLSLFSPCTELFSSQLQVVLSVVSASALAFPHPDEYEIPTVGTNQRSQYYVLHDDGSFKYGYDTGEDAFESQKTESDGEVKGKFGYRDLDGQEIRLQYTSGPGGFVAEGDHIPKVHPDVAAAFAAARSSKPFVDPLAGGDGDRSYNFEFGGDEHSRNEESDSDGTVRGSYSYVDEFGRKRSYTYRAGKGIGFVIEGDDIPQQVQPLPTHTTTTQFGASRHTPSQAAPTRPVPQRVAAHSSKVGASSVQQTKFKAPVAKPTTYFAPTAPKLTVASAPSRSAVSSSIVRSHKQPASQVSPVVAPATRQTTRNFESARVFEPANTRSSQSPSGSYSLAYETSSHSRNEQGDDDNNVRGRFAFTADDDDTERSVTYEAGSATGFIAEGAHLPIGPIVPGAPTGQVTGRIAPVVSSNYVDPLAKENMDASYSFGFESDDYSRTEVADEDGNVSGTYSILGEDNILRTYKFRAGKGIGFETEEISSVPGNRRSQVSTSSHSQSGSTRSGIALGSGTQGLPSHLSSNRGSSTSSLLASASSTTGSSQRTTFSQHSSPQNTASIVPTVYSGSETPFASRATAQSSAFPVGANRPSSQTRPTIRTSYKSSQQNEVFPGFTLRQYDPSEGRGKYGYVLKFDD